MKANTVVFGVALLLFVLCLGITSTAATAGDNGSRKPGTRNIEVVNQCAFPVWIGVQGDPNISGFKTEAGQAVSFPVSHTINSARVWARTGCTRNERGHLVCTTGDCPLPASWYNDQNDGTECKGIGGLSPASLAEFTLGGSNMNDFYDLSLVDGFSVPVSMRPENFTKTPALGQDDKFNCGAPSCPAFDFSKCPPELRRVDSNGHVYACMSICAAVHDEGQRSQHPILQNIFESKDPHTGFPMKNLVCCACGEGTGGCADANSQFCCSPHNLPSPNEKGGKCHVEHWPLASDGQKYDEVFKNQCPEAYSWQFDDHQSTYQCVGADYIITFCP